jgi:hypothetical protein
MLLVIMLVDPAQLASAIAMFVVVGVIAYVLRRQFRRVSNRARADAQRAKMLNDIPSELRFRAYERDHYTCQRCGTTSDLIVDFVDTPPVSEPVRLEDLITRCTRCVAIVRQSGIMH